MSQQPLTRSAAARVAGSLCVAAALVARLLYVWGPPHGGDERYVVLHALKFGTGDFNPGHFDWPASPLYYLTFVLYGLHFLGGYLLGVYPDGQTFAVGALAQPALYYVVPRLISAAFGLATAWVLWRHLSRWLGVGPAAFAALYVLVAPGHLRMSRSGLADVPMTFFLTLTLLLSLSLVRRRHADRSDFVRGGIWVGLATAMKYPGALSSVSLAGVHAATKPASRARWLVLAAACSVATFFVVTPFALLDYRVFMGDLAFMTGHADGGSSLGVRLHKVAAIANAAIGLPLLAVALVGAGIALRRRREYVPVWAAVVPVALAFALALVITRESFPRYAVPLVPELAIFTAVGWHAIVNDSSLKPLAWPFGAAAALAATLALVPAIREARLASRQTTDSAAATWVLAHTSESDAIAGDELSSILPSDSAIRRETAEARSLGLRGRQDYWQGMARLLSGVTTLPRRDVQVIYMVDPVDGRIDALMQAGVKFYVCNETIAAMTTSRSGGDRARERTQHYGDLRSRGTLEARFDDRDGTLQGGPLSVYRLPPQDGRARPRAPN